MRALLLALTLTGFSAAPALGVSPAFPPSRTVHLDGPADLARLQASNPGHYARALKVLAAASHLCRPGSGQLQQVDGARDVKCEGQFLLTSNPPQVRMAFTLDDTRYIALIFLTDDPSRLMPAH